MIGALALLLAYQLAGEVIRVAFALPVPGPVIGMLLLFVSLALRGGPAPGKLRKASQGLLRHLSLLFVPAGTGVMLHLDRLQDEGLPILAALVVSTLLALVATAGTLHLLTKKSQKGPAP
ncbi:MAG: CidA/LrgA family protein [Rhodocyclaceae bacterium]|nr:CidA/LrgA family protein [Rhodocyclaceae bacterium]